MEPRVIFEDNHLLVVEKPVNVPTQADSSGDRDLLTWMKDYLKQKYQKPGNVYLGLVHRLDRPVGGVLVLAKTSKAAGRLSEQVRENRFRKIYLAVVHGRPRESQQLTHYLLKNTAKNQVAVVPEETAGAKKAVLEYETLETEESLSLVKIRLHTGRSHQIRAQMAAIGHPLFGDQKYGIHVNRPGQQLALWAVEVGFIHPVSRESVSFTSQPPKEFPWTEFDINN
ncbi:MAG TPA: RluA family pseudouridine synthase [Bacillota bacterium]|nr:RluA family pseudouridine synthase [Bacillota bacterium]